MFSDMYYSRSHLKSLNNLVINDLKKFNLFIPIHFDCVLLNDSRGFFSTKYNRKRVVLSQISLTEFINNFIGRKVATSIGIKYSDAVNMKELLYHEYGHVFSESHSNSKIFLKQFKEKFGNYFSIKEYEFDPDIYISNYASYNPDEDFAECFMYFMKWKGKWKNRQLPGKKYINGVYHKLAFIDSLTKR